MAATEYASRSVRGLRLVIERCNALDQLIRAELRMD